MFDDKLALTTTNPRHSRYEILCKIAAGGMASVYLGALKGPLGFEQLVAIKRLHAHLLDEPSVRESLLVEARLAARIRHANVVDVRDVELLDGTLQLVMTYVEGASLAQLMVAKEKLPTKVVLRIILDACAGLHAAHQLTDDEGRNLGLVHRDISPQNLLVGVDGTARITDFGVARDNTDGRLRTSTGMLKGKFAYMAPEYISGRKLDRQADVFALGVVCWEALAGRRLFKGNNDADTISRVTMAQPPKLREFVPDLDERIDDVLSMALSKNPATRFVSAEAFGTALEALASKSTGIATYADVGRHVRTVAHEDLQRLADVRRAAAKRAAEQISVTHTPAASTIPTVIAPPPAHLLEQATPASASVTGEIDTRVVAKSEVVEDPTTVRRNNRRAEPLEGVDAFLALGSSMVSSESTMPAPEAPFHQRALPNELTPAVAVYSAAEVHPVGPPMDPLAVGGIGPKGTFVMVSASAKRSTPAMMTLRSPLLSSHKHKSVDSLEECLHVSPKRSKQASRDNTRTLPFPAHLNRKPIMPFQRADGSKSSSRKLFLLLALGVFLATSIVVVGVATAPTASSAGSPGSEVAGP